MSGIEVLVVTADPATSETVLNPWNDGTVHVSNSITEGMRLVDSAVVDVVALDFNGKLDNLEFALSDIRDLSPTVALLVFCEKEQVNEISESEISGSIFRILPKPLAVGQSHLAFKSAYSNHLELEARQTSGENLSIPLTVEEQPSQLKYLFFLCLMTFAAWFAYELFNEANDPERMVDAANNSQGRDIEIISSEDNQINQLYNLAQAAAKGFQFQSAASLYDQILEIDPYDGDALAGHESIKELITDRTNIAINNKNVLEAHRQLDELNRIYPDYKPSSDLSAKLATLNQPSSTQQPDSISSNIISPIEPRIVSDVTPEPSDLPLIQTLQDSDAKPIVLPPDPVLAKIDAALESSIDSELLTSDAFRLLLAKVNIGPLTPQYTERLDKLEQRLHSLGIALINEHQSDELDSLTQTIRSFPSLASLADSLEQTMLTTSRSIVSDAATTQNFSETQPIVAPTSMSIIAASSKVIPAVKISGNNPIYPRNAERRGIEGFVELEFTITQMGRVESVSISHTTPEGVFDEAAITAVSSWRYQPRLVDDQPVSERKQVRLGFRL